MSGRSPEISVVIPCYNAERFVGEAVESALGQRGVRHEVIVVDDGSTDGSPAVLEGFRRHIVLIRQENRGEGGARNRGITAARGRYLAFLDADDWWDPSFLEQMHAAIRKCPGAGLAYCGWRNVGLEGPRGEPFVPPDYEGPDKLRLLLENTRWPVHAAMVERRLALEAGGFATDLRYCADFLFWLEIASRTRLAWVPAVLAYYRHHRPLHLATASAPWALAHLEAQRRFLRRHPEVRRRLGRRTVRRIVYGELRRRAYESYWRRDLASARVLFRRLLRAGYVRRGDLPRLALALAPRRMMEAVLAARDAREARAA